MESGGELYNPYKWPSKWATGIITPVSGGMALLTTGRGPPCGFINFSKGHPYLRRCSNLTTIVMLN